MKANISAGLAMIEEMFLQPVNKVFIDREGKFLFIEIRDPYPPETLCTIDGRDLVPDLCRLKSIGFRSGNEVVNIEKLHVGWQEGGGLEEVGGVKVRFNFDRNAQFLPEFTFEAINRPFAKLETATREFGHKDSQPELIGHQHPPVVDEQSVNPDVKLIDRHDVYFAKVSRFSWSGQFFNHFFVINRIALNYFFRNSNEAMTV